MDNLDAETKAALADVYERAAEYLEVYGWIQDALGEPGGPRCISGALRSATVSNHAVALQFACDVLELGNCGIPRCTCGSPMVGWNDAPGRTKDEVINTLHALSNKLR